MIAILSQLDIYSVSGGEGESSDVSDFEDYTPVHICRTGCPIIKVDSGKLGKLAERGRSICIAFRREDPAEPLRIIELDLSQTSQGTPNSNAQYVAISHVRAEGMGNSRGAELPQCRIREIQGFVDALTGSAAGQTFFWIDSLCVPSADYRAKKLAARQICRVFASAHSVLALVPSVMSFKSSGTPSERLLAVIAASPWPKRLWTFQEGAVANDFLFQFKDRAVALNRLLPTGGVTTPPGFPTGNDKLESLLNKIVQFSEDIKVDGFPNRLSYGKEENLKLSRHRAKARLRGYLRLCFLMLPLFRYFATERERIVVPKVKLVLDNVYGAVDSNDTVREQRIRRLKSVLGLLEGTVV
ncbi:hypothetical protein MFIFM68171_02949 [Madurella fahalii]|uniref:Heterokaryon incompatibility domain-containing protein n=1 Tax=Madurella fahalii TaxID=1157608 RepID=A0ABQ0G4R8_9PEZI